ncbi:MAG: ATP-dependent DNA helicase UvrD2 [Actinomycetota bacterium]
MPTINCHHCGGTHSSVAEVRSCWRSGDAPLPQSAAAAQAAHPSGGPAPGPSGGPAPGPSGGPAPGPSGGLAPGPSGGPAPGPSGGPAGANLLAAAGDWPAALGRSVLVDPGAPAPPGWEGAHRLQVDPLALSASGLAEIERIYRERVPTVFEVVGELPSEKEVTFEAPWALSPGFFFPLERVIHALTANSVDARGSGRPRWKPGGLAMMLGARAGGTGDVILPDGWAALCDGGPMNVAARAGTILHLVGLEAGSLEPLGSNECRADLAPDQLAAVTHDGAAARIIAPAGSGKTRVLTERARHLIRSWKVPPWCICMVAYNRRAAGEMRERTTDLPGLRIRTLNSLALAIASGSGEFGGGPVRQTIDERAVRQILDGLVTFPRRMNQDPAAAWIESLSAVRLGLRPPLEVEAEYNGDVDGLAEVFDRYRQELRSRGALDYDDQIYSALEVLLTDPAARVQARSRCRLMLVDEFQDLTPAHLLMIRLLAGPQGSVFGVGDDDQTIYGYSDASPDWLINYARYFPGAGMHGLEVNYRCPEPVVTAARNLLTHNRQRVAKRIRPAPGRARGEHQLVIEQGGNPCAGTTEAVVKLVEEGSSPSSVAVLCRVNHSLAPIQISLAHRGIPAVKAVDVSYLQRTGVKAALAWLRLVGASRLRKDDVALTARRPPRALSPKVIEWMGEQRSVSGLISLAERLGGRDAGKIEAYAGDLEMLQELASKGSAAPVLEALRDRVGLATAIEALDRSHRRLDRSPQTDDLNVLIELARLCPEGSDFQRWLEDALGQPSNPEGVILATVHAVKGREWDHVVVHDVSEGLMPHRLAADDEEERRVFHVALTRCRRSVTLVAGGTPSRFLDEMSAEWVEPEQPSRQPEAGPAGNIVPEIGMAVMVGGYRGAVIGLEQLGAIVRVDRSTTTIAYGQWVEANGAWGRFVAPAAGKPAPPEAVVAALKEWRREKARAEGKPAYVFLHDATLEDLASSGARTLNELALVKGIGPAKLEAFGDELLSVLEAAAPPED